MEVAICPAALSNSKGRKAANQRDEVFMSAPYIVPTPDGIKRFMTSLARPVRFPSSVLEVACGDAPFLHAFAEMYGKEHHFTGVEILPELARQAREKVPFATIIEEDFLLWETCERFDVIVGNPPYGIVGNAQHYARYNADKSLYKPYIQTWRGQYNIYGAFVERSVRLLSPDGKAILVIPSGWMVLDSFVLLRQFLAREGGLDIYYLGRAFPAKKVSVVVMVFHKGGEGVRLFAPDQEVPVVKENYNGEMIRFETPEVINWERSGVPLGEIFEVHVAPRSGELRKYPFIENSPRPGFVPILTGRNMKPAQIDYDTCYSGLWMPLEEAPSLRAFFGFPHVVVGHTRGARLVSARDTRCYPWREEYHLVPKVPVDEASVVEYLNGTRMQRYIGTLYRGTTHVTASMLRLVPIPHHLIG